MMYVALPVGTAAERKSEEYVTAEAWPCASRHHTPVMHTHL